MNTVKPPECWSTDPNAHAIRIEVSPGNSLLLPYDQFIYAEVHTEEVEQHLRLAFATHKIHVRGRSLRRIEIALQRKELSLLAVAPDNHRGLGADGQTVVVEIQVAESQDAIEQASGRGTGQGTTETRQP